MLPTQLLRNHAGQIEGAELDQTLVWLYQVCRESHEAQEGRRYLELPHGERMRRFRDWLTRIFREEDAVQDTMKIERFFARELPVMRDAWREALGNGCTSTARMENPKETKE